MGLLTDEGATAILEHRAAFAHLERLVLHTTLLERTASAITSLPNVELSTEREPHAHEEERYVAVGE